MIDNSRDNRSFSRSCISFQNKNIVLTQFVNKLGNLLEKNILLLCRFKRKILFEYRVEFGFWFQIMLISVYKDYQQRYNAKTKHSKEVFYSTTYSASTISDSRKYPKA